MAPKARLQNDNPAQSLEGARTELHAIEERLRVLTEEVHRLEDAKKALTEAITSAEGQAKRILDQADKTAAATQEDNLEAARQRDAARHALDERQTKLAALQLELALGAEELAAKEIQVESLRQDLKTRLETLSIGIEAHRRDVGQHQSRISAQEDELISRDLAVTRRENKIGEREGELATAEQSVKDCEGAIATREREVAARGELTTAKQMELGKKELELKAQAVLLAEREATVSDKETALKERDAQLGRLNEGLEIRSRELDARETDLRVLRSKYETPKPSTEV